MRKYLPWVCSRGDKLEIEQITELGFCMKCASVCPKGHKVPGDLEVRRRCTECGRLTLDSEAVVETTHEEAEAAAKAWALRATVFRRICPDGHETRFIQNETQKHQAPHCMTCGSQEGTLRREVERECRNIECGRLYLTLSVNSRYCGDECRRDACMVRRNENRKSRSKRSRAA